MNPLLHAWERLQQRTLTVQQSREVDQLAVTKYHLHSLTLMENAAIHSAAWLRHRFPSPQMTTILCGRGNNGGDGLAMARHLTASGWPCSVILQGPIAALSPDAQANYEILTTGGGLTVHDNQGPLPATLVELLRASTVIIDALLGTGGRGGPRPPMDQWIELANSTPAFRLAIDVPTGVDAETGEHGACVFRADATLTFVSLKPAMSQAASRSVFGELTVLPIGIPAQMMLEVIEWPNN